MGEVPPLTEVYRKYQLHGFQFFIVYSREAHPGENYPHHESFAQKLEHAQALREKESVNEIPILIDDLHGTMHRAYGSLPNMVYLIDRNGTVVYKSDWSDSHELDGMCDSLVRLDRLKAEGRPIIRKGISERVHWIPMDPQQRENVYRRSGQKAIRDYYDAKGVLPYAPDVEAKRS